MADAGERLEQLLARLGETGPADLAERPLDASQAVPAEGWRILDTQHGQLLLGAPEDEGRTHWRLAHLEPASPTHLNGLLRIHPDVFSLRPSQRERGRGLRLEWPAVVRSEPDLENLWIDIVNDGDERWRPNGDGFHVGAGIGRPGREGARFGFVGGRDTAFPLDPGDYGRVRANLDLGSLDGMEPGEAEVHAWLVDLSLRTIDPLRVQITSEMLERRRADVAAHPPRPDDAGHATRQRIAMLRTVVTARGRLREIVEIILEPSTDREQSIDGIAELLECSPGDARGIYSTSLQRFDLQHEDQVTSELQGLERSLRELGARSTNDEPAADG